MVDAVYWDRSQLEESVVSDLIERGDLPEDFYFRLAIIEDVNIRSEVALTSIRSGLGLEPQDEESRAYLSGDLPNCVFINGRFNPVRLLGHLDEDFHCRRELYPIDDESFTGTSVEFMEIVQYARKLWSVLVRNIDPELDERIRKLVDNRARYYHLQLGHVIIKDNVLMDVYNGEVESKGIGPVLRKMLRDMLLDNHFELLDI